MSPPGNSPGETPPPSRSCPAIVDADFFASLRAGPTPATPVPSSANRSNFHRPRTSRPPISSFSSPATPASSAVRPRTAPAALAPAGIRRMSAECAKSVRIGQALLDAASVVKELVENAVDAGATRVDVRLIGKAACDRVVVTDNGSGVRRASHASLCKPYSTSKLADFDDLAAISTFGFRGEAMSAIAALCSSVTVTTRTADEDVGRSLVYDPAGSLLKDLPAPRPVGTTIQVENLFSRLPVRLKDATKHSARDISRCLRLVQEYALACTAVRFELRVGNDTKLVTQPKSPASPEEALATAVAAVLGRTQAATMVPCSKLALLHCGDGDEGEDGAALDLDDNGTVPSSSQKSAYSLLGLVSKSNHGGAGGGGRLSGTWQFIFLNGRPVEMPRLVRAVNESYRRFALSSAASPAFVFSFSVPAGHFDVNLSPDKRQVMINREADLIAALQLHLESVWCPKDSRTMPANGSVPLSHLVEEKKAGVEDLGTGSPVEEAEVNDQPASKVVPFKPSLPTSPSPLLAGKSGVGSLLLSRKRRDNSELLAAPDGKRLKSISLSSFIAQRREKFRAENAPVPQLAGSRGSNLTSSKEQSPPSDPTTTKPDASSPVVVIDDVDTEGVIALKRKMVGSIAYSLEAVKKERSASKRERVSPDAVLQALDEEILTSTVEMKAKSFASSSLCDGQSQVSPSQEPDADRERAELELVRVFRQSWFNDLKVVGQFNLGFIICILGGTDLFIVDQHASDEKHNFEDLARNTAIDTQQLVRPMALDLAVEDELLVIDNLPRFKRSGFDIEHRPSKLPTQRLYLRSQPSSKRTMFVIDDLREMIGTLKRNGSSGNAVLRPERVRAMFASRACRKSVMIGTALTVPQMTRLVRQLHGLEHPWSCPHGRPTMRHLMDISCLDSH